MSMDFLGSSQDTNNHANKIKYGKQTADSIQRKTAVNLHLSNKIKPERSISWDNQSQRSSLSHKKKLFNQAGRKSRVYQVVFGKTYSSLQGMQRKSVRKFDRLNMNKGKGNREKIAIIEGKKYSTIHTQGLCRFEFEKTIKGRMQNKTNYHLKFGNQTPRKMNIEYEEQATPSISNIRIQKKIKNKCHDFNSYTDRKVFEPQKTVDDFYEKQKSMAYIARPNPNFVYMQKTTGRKNPESLTSHLSYDQARAKEKSFPHSPRCLISSTRKEFSFNRQVISSERGCYR